MLPPAVDLPRQLFWNVQQWTDHLKPYIEEMTEQTEEAIDHMVGRRLGVQVSHLQDAKFVEAWMELKCPFTNKMAQHWNIAMNPVLRKFDGSGFSKEVACDQFWLMRRSSIGDYLVNGHKFCAYFLLHHGYDYAALPDTMKTEIIDFLSTGVKAASVASLSGKLIESERLCKNQKELIETHEKSIDELERVERILRSDAEQTDLAQDAVVLENQKLKAELKATKDALKEANVKIAFLTGMLVPGAAKPPAGAPVQPAVNPTVPSPPAIHPPPNGSVSWNVTYAGREQGNNDRRGRGDNHHQQHQGRGYQKRYRGDNGNGHHYHATGREDYYGQGDGRNFH
jgi:hypothetical protein